MHYKKIIHQYKVIRVLGCHLRNLMRIDRLLKLTVLYVIDFYYMSVKLTTFNYTIFYKVPPLFLTCLNQSETD